MKSHDLFICISFYGDSLNYCIMRTLTLEDYVSTNTLSIDGMYSCIYAVAGKFVKFNKSSVIHQIKSIQIPPIIIIHNG